MKEQHLRDLLENVRNGELSVEEGLVQLKDYPYHDLGFATVDHHRPMRQGFPEVIFGEGKTTPQIISIMSSLRDRGDDILATRVSPEKGEQLLAEFPEAVYYATAGTLTLSKEPVREETGCVMVICAGTSDLPVAEEAVVTARFFGNHVESLYDVGVSGVHRLLSRRSLLERAWVFIVVAGMEGALPSVVGGLVKRPVIAVPTSVGYGASFGGLAALLGMLNSCASNVAVVNIDNGFGAAFIASLINQAGRL